MTTNLLKNTSKFILLILFVLSTKGINAQDYKYSENVSFKIENIRENSSLATGHQSWVSPSRGYKFVIITLVLKNLNNKLEHIDFDNFHLINPNRKTKHQVEFVRTTGLIPFPSKILFNLKKNKRKKRDLIFIYPKLDTPEFILFNDDLITIPKNI